MDKAQDPFLFTLVKLSKVKNYSDKFSSVKTVRGTRNTNNSGINNEYLEGDNTVETDVRLVKEVDNVEDDISGTQGSGASSSSSRTEVESSSSFSFLVKFPPLSSQLGLSTAYENFTEVWSHLLDNPWERLKSEIREGFEQISTEIVDEIGGENTSGIEKMIPVVLDSVHFQGGTLMLLAYGDTEPR